MVGRSAAEIHVVISESYHSFSTGRLPRGEDGREHNRLCFDFMASIKYDTLTDKEILAYFT